MNTEAISLEHRIIVNWVKPQSSVLDLGCGDGELLQFLATRNQCRGHGIEIDEHAIYACMLKGLNVLHQDIDSGLGEYNDASFDYVILDQSLQQIKHFETVLNDALRVGKKVIVGFPNFAYYKARFQLGLCGHAPITKSLPYTWYTSPNVHFLSIADFMVYCRQKNIRIEKTAYTSGARRVVVVPNLFAQVGLFLITRNTV